MTRTGPAGLVCMLHDITERKRMEEELFRHREDLMHLVDERIAELKQEIVKREAMEESLLRSQKLEFLSEAYHTNATAEASETRSGAVGVRAG